MRYLRNILLCISMLFSIDSIYSQSVNQYIITPISFIYNAEINIDIVAGETINTTLNTENSALTQGFLQPENYLFLHVESQVNSFFRFFPNPVSEGIYIEFKKECGSEMKCLIFNAMGQVVKNIEFSLGFQNKLYIDLSILDKGIYLMSMDDIENNMNSTLKLIKQ